MGQKSEKILLRARFSEQSDGSHMHSERRQVTAHDGPVPENVTGLAHDAAISEQDLLRVRDRMLENRPYEPHVHVVHPQYTGRTIARTFEEIDVKTICANCFNTIWLTKVLS